MARGKYKGPKRGSGQRNRSTQDEEEDAFRAGREGVIPLAHAAKRAYALSVVGNKPANGMYCSSLIISTEPGRRERESVCGGNW